MKIHVHFRVHAISMLNMLWYVMWCYTPICHVYSFCNKTFTHMYVRYIYMFISVHVAQRYSIPSFYVLKLFKPPKGNFIFYNIKRFSSLYFLSVSEQFSNKINCQPITYTKYNTPCRRSITKKLILRVFMWRYILLAYIFFDTLRINPLFVMGARSSSSSYLTWNIYNFIRPFLMFIPQKRMSNENITKGRWFSIRTECTRGKNWIIIIKEKRYRTWIICIILYIILY